jgi:hypothetical protein
MALPRTRGKRLDVYLDDEVYSKAIRRFQNLDAKIEQLLRDDIEREEQADAAHGFEANVELDAGSGFQDFGASSDEAFFEMNPEVQNSNDQTGQGKRDRLPVLKPKRRQR